MIRLAEIDNVSDKVLFSHFESALIELGLAAWLTMLKPGKEELFRRRIKGHVYSTLEWDPWIERRTEVLADAENHLRWEPLDQAEEEIWSHYRLQSAIVATLLGDSDQLKTLSAQLVTEPVNRKLMIAYFLGHLTNGRVGLQNKEIPTKGQILRWVQDIYDIDLEDKLKQFSGSKFR